MLNKIINDPDRNLYCFDWEELKDEMVIYGVSSYTEFQYIDFALVPCQYNHTINGWMGDTIHPDCVWDRQAQMDYLGNMRALVYMTEQIF